MAAVQFTGLSAFTFTPIGERGIDPGSYAGIVDRVAAAGVDSICALGSTGGYAYLDAADRARIAKLTVEHAGGIPVIVGIGALTTQAVLGHAEAAEHAGAAAVLLAPVSYQPLTDDEVYDLYATVCAAVSVPVVVYDNPTTTGFTFTPDLTARVAELPAIASVKIPPLPVDETAAAARLAGYRAAIPERVTIGISGDGGAAGAMLAGVDGWYSVMAGLLPHECAALTRAALAGDAATVRELNGRFARLWQLFAAHGSYRVAAAAAEALGLTPPGMLPRPVAGLPAQVRQQVAEAVRAAQSFAG